VQATGIDRQTPESRDVQKKNEDYRRKTFGEASTRGGPLPGTPRHPQKLMKKKEHGTWPAMQGKKPDRKEKKTHEGAFVIGTPPTQALEEK